MSTATHRLSLILVLGLLMALVAAPATSTAQQKDQATEDIIHMNDGRVLNGEILNETPTSIEFEYRDRVINAAVKLTLLKSQISKIERDVVIKAQEAPAGDEPAPVGDSPNRPAPTKTASEAELRERYGIRRLQTQDSNVPSIYIVPMRGQLGTDVMADVYEPIIKDIREKKPDVVVIEINCEDVQETYAAAMGDINLDEFGYLDYDESNKLVNLFHNELHGIRQVVWIHNSVGMSSVVSLAWREVFMRPSARLAGMVMVLIHSGAKGWTDADLRAKMMAYFTGAATSFLERGGHAHELGLAMMDPEHFLSAAWEGRKVRWMLDDSGEYLVDANDRMPSNFTAKMAEDFCISSGTAEDLDDLALLLGFREYRVVDGIAENAVNRYITDWRRMLQDAKDEWQNYQKYMRWVGGADSRQNMGRAKTALERILAAMKRYKAVEIRLLQEVGLTRHYVQVEIEKLREQIAGSNMQGGGGRTGGGGQGMGGGGRGGGGP